MQPDNDSKNKNNVEYVVEIGEYWSEWSRCHTFRHQRDQLYRFGKLDDCAKQWTDYKTTMQAQFCRDPVEARKLVESTHLHHERVAAATMTVGVIWQLKEKPSWD
jgi:Protein of unknown function (DUF3128)